MSEEKTIKQPPSLKSFSLVDILSLSSGLLLPYTDARAVHDLIAYLTGTDISDADAQAKDAKSCLEEQLPFLKVVDYTPLHGALKTGKMEDQLYMWLDVQEKRFGTEHFLMPMARWARRRNSHKL